MLIRNLVSATLAMSLAACGGGSSNSSTPMPMGNIVASDDTYTFYSGDFQDLFVLQNDSTPAGDTLTLVAVATPTHGTASPAATCVFSIPEGSQPASAPCVNYRPDAGFVGTDSFSYTVQDGFGRTASAQIHVTISDHYTVSGNVLVPPGSISATQVGFEGQPERAPIAADGSFSLSAAVGSGPVLVADAAGSAPSLRARLGTFGEPMPANFGADPGNPFTLSGVRLDAFSTAVQAALAEPTAANYVQGVSVDWQDILDRTTLIQLALEAGGSSIGLPKPTTIAEHADVLAVLRAQFGTSAINERRLQLLADSTLVPLMPVPQTPTQIVAYSADPSAWRDVLLVQFTGAGTATYSTALGSGDAAWTTSNGVVAVTPFSGPSSAIGSFTLQLIGTVGADRFGVIVQSQGQLGSAVWNGELAPTLTASPDGYETASLSLVDPLPVISTTHRLPMCTLPVGASMPVDATLVFHADSSGTLAGNGQPFSWLQSRVLSARFADSLATYITTARAAGGGGRVIAVQKFSDNTQVLCAGLDALQP